MNKECDCKHSGIRIVRGNDVTIEAVVSVFDKATGTYSPSDLSEVEGVSLNMVGPYGVEIIFKDSAGKSRMYERDLVRVVESGEEAVGCAGSADGRTVTVDLKTRIITLGGVPIVILDEAAYAALEKKDPGTLYVITGGSGDED